MELTRHLEHAKVAQPSHFMVGSLDPVMALIPGAFADLERNVQDLRANVVLDGAGHWLPLERSKEVNAALLDFLAGLDN